MDFCEFVCSPHYKYSLNEPEEARWSKTVSEMETTLLQKGNQVKKYVKQKVFLDKLRIA